MKKAKQKILIAVLVLGFVFIPLIVVLWLENDRKSSAKRLFEEGNSLLAQATAESLNSALERFDQARSLYQLTGQKEDEAETLHKLGLANYLLSNYSEALKFYEEELLLREEGDGNNKSKIAFLFKDMGRVYSALDSKEQALKYYKDSLQLWKESGDKEGQATALINIGTVYQETGRKREALSKYFESLGIQKYIGDRKGQAYSLNNIGTVYRDLRLEIESVVDHQNPVPRNPSSLDQKAKSKKRPDPSGTPKNRQPTLKSKPVPKPTLRSRPVPKPTLKSKPKNPDCILTGDCDFLASSTSALKTRSRAANRNIALIDESLAASDSSSQNKTGFTWEYAVIQSQEEETGNDQPDTVREKDIKNGRTEIHYFKEALSIWRELDDKQGEAVTLNSIGVSFFETGKQTEAIENINQSLHISRLTGNKEVEGQSLNNLMAIWEENENHKLSIFFGKQSINVFQQIRSNIQKLDLSLQKSYLTLVGDTYRFLADILITAGRIPEAEQVLGMLKDEEAFSYLRRDDRVAKDLIQTVSMSEAEREALTKYSEFADRITQIGSEFARLDAERLKAPEGQFSKQARYDELKQQLKDARSAFENFLDQLKIEFGQNDERIAKVDSSLQSLLNRLNATRTAVISTIVGQDRLNIFVTTANTQRAHTIDISEKEVNDLVRDFRQELKTPKFDPRPTGGKLYNILVKPVEKDLAGIEADTIVWSLDGTLRYIPPAALWDEKRKKYLAERFANSIITLASRETLALSVSNKKSWRALGVGVSKATENFSALDAVPDELDCIVTDPENKTVSVKPICSTGVVTGKKLLDERFTLAAFEDALGRYHIVHIASHFKLNPGNENDSFLLLGGGESNRFTVRELRGVSLTNVELFALSACNTATPGGTKANGVEIEGFGAVAQKQGAKAVLASLWAVADPSTRDLMTEFYRQLQTNPQVGKAEALRAAQIALLSGQIEPTSEDGELRAEVNRIGGNEPQAPLFIGNEKSPYAHPYYWSPFILYGNWK